jgi:putative phage-type endonuclease
VNHSEEWYAARLTRIGGSDVAGVLGVSPWESPYSLWHAKRNGWIDYESTPQQDWGSRLESALLGWYFDNHGVEIKDSGGTYVNVHRNWQLFNPDALAWDKGDGEHVLLEAKSARRGDDWGRPGTDEIPVYYRPQVVWGMDCLGLRKAKVVVSIAGAPPVLFAVDYNEAEAVAIREMVGDFVMSLRIDEEPPLDRHVATYETVRRLHPDIDPGLEVEVPTRVALDYISAKRVLKAAEGAQSEAAARLLVTMGKAQYATWSGTRIARRQSTGTALPHPVYALKETK